MAEQKTCAWAMNHPLEREYHDSEWGKPVYDDTVLFEFMTLEGAQAGLSWITILKKRQGYREAFEGYDLKRLAQQGEQRVEEIIAQYDVVKHRGKIASVFSNARAALALQEELVHCLTLCGRLLTISRLLTNGNRWMKCPRSRSNPKRSASFLKSVASSLLEKPFVMPSCKRSGWLMII